MYNLLFNLQCDVDSDAYGSSVCLRCIPAIICQTGSAGNAVVANMTTIRPGFICCAVHAADLQSAVTR
jgi:hypothetical protein